MTLFILEKFIQINEGGGVFQIGEIRGKDGGREIKEKTDENMSYLRVKEGKQEQAGWREEEEERGILLTTAKLSPTAHGHFSGTFLQVQAQKELAGGVVNLFPM